MKLLFQFSISSFTSGSSAKTWEKVQISDLSVTIAYEVVFLTTPVPKNVAKFPHSLVSVVEI